MENTIALVINHALELLLAPLLVWLFTKAGNWLNANSAEKWGRVANTAVAEAVDAIEQTLGKSASNVSKKTQAIATAKAALGPAQVKAIEKATGAPIEQTLDTKIEASVRAAKAVQAVQGVAVPLGK